MAIGMNCSSSVRNSSSHNRAAKAKILLCAVVLGTLLASVAYPQYLEATIKLPDTLGPLNGPYHLAWDENPAHRRLYIGGEADSGGVVVAEAITCKRLARVRTGPVKALCFVPPHRKLYVSRLDTDSLLVVDCATNQITSAIRTGGILPVMQYNARNDRLYCGGDSITVVDCAGDTVTRTITVAASSFAYDSVSNKLYVGRNGPLAVIDCTSDSVVAAISEVNSAKALCFNSTAQKVYAVTTNTLFAIRADGDSVVARLPFDSLKPLLAVDHQRNRVYCTGSRREWGFWSSVDCSADTVLQKCNTTLPVTFLACNTARDLLYVFFRSWFDEVYMFDATTAQQLTSVTTDGVPCGGGWSPVLDRLYCLPPVDPERPGYSCCLLSAVDGAGDSIVGIVPLTVRAGKIALDTVHNRLYFSYGSTGCGCIGVVDCAQNIVTSYVYGGANPAAMCYNPNNNRLYWRAGRSMTVYDCSTGTVAGKVRTSGNVRAARLHLGLNRLFAYARDAQGNDIIDIIDCGCDSVVRSVYLPDDGSSVQEVLLVPEDNRLWCLGAWSLAVIDCLGDSIIATAPDTLAVEDLCYSWEDRRIYLGANEDAWRLNMDKPDEVDTLHPRIPGGSLMRFLSIPGAHKAYLAVSNSGVSTHFFKIDTKTSALVDSFWLDRGITGMCLDHSGDYVYCASIATFEPTAVVLDARSDSVVATFDLPPMITAEKNPFVPNRATNRIYVAQYDEFTCGNEIPVIRDSIVIGVEEPALASPSRPIVPTVVSRGTPMRVWTASELWDATGRRAAVLRSGPNDISHLAPGIYFVREKPLASRNRPQATRKIVIAE